MTRSSGLLSAIIPDLSRNSFALLPVTRDIASAGLRSPSDASSQIDLIIPNGMTPVPVGVSLPIQTRVRALASRESLMM